VPDTHIVRRPYRTGGKPIKSGDKVDASGYRNLRLMVDQGYLEALPPGGAAKAANGRTPTVRKKKTGRRASKVAGKKTARGRVASRGAAA